MMECEFHGCTKNGQLWQYGSSPQMVTKHAWCEDHRTEKLRHAAELRQAGMADDETEIESRSAPDIGAAGCARRIRIGNRWRWVWTKDQEKAWQEKCAVREAASRKHAMEQEAIRAAARDAFQEARHAVQAEASRIAGDLRRRATPRTRKPLPERRNDLEPQIVTTTSPVLIGEHSGPPCPGDGYIPWGSPIAATIDGVSCMAQAWRKRTAPDVEPGKANGRKRPAILDMRPEEM